MNNTTPLANINKIENNRVRITNIRFELNRANITNVLHRYQYVFNDLSLVLSEQSGTNDINDFSNESLELLASLLATGDKYKWMTCIESSMKKFRNDYGLSIKIEYHDPGLNEPVFALIESGDTNIDFNSYGLYTPSDVYPGNVPKDFIKGFIRSRKAKIIVQDFYILDGTSLFAYVQEIQMARHTANLQFQHNSKAWIERLIETHNNSEDEIMYRPGTKEEFDPEYWNILGLDDYYIVKKSVGNVGTRVSIEDFVQVMVSYTA